MNNQFNVKQNSLKSYEKGEMITVNELKGKAVYIVIYYKYSQRAAEINQDIPRSCGGGILMKLLQISPVNRDNSVLMENNNKITSVYISLHYRLHVFTFSLLNSMCVKYSVSVLIFIFNFVIVHSGLLINLCGRQLKLVVLMPRNQTHTVRS